MTDSGVNGGQDDAGQQERPHGSGSRLGANIGAYHDNEAKPHQTDYPSSHPCRPEDRRSFEEHGVQGLH